MQTVLLSAPILFFLMGILAKGLGSSIEIRPGIRQFLSIYLLIAIGLKGGMHIGKIDQFNYSVLSTATVGILSSLLLPILGYWILKAVARLDKPTIAAISAHYGSISLVTFLTAIGFMQDRLITYSGYMVAIAALMEAPAILSGLFIAKRKSSSLDIISVLKEIFTNWSVFFLISAFIIGIVATHTSLQSLHGFFVLPFDGILCLFLMSMGIEVAKESKHLSLLSPSVMAFGIVFPLLCAILCLMACYALGISASDGFLLTTLCASASYIAVPASMEHALPEAKSSLFLPMTLGITFPFNILVGIPAYYALARMLLT